MCFVPQFTDATDIITLESVIFPMRACVHSSFIHIEHLYSASSRKLLRSAPNTSTVKQSSLKVRKNAGEVVLLKMRSSGGRPFQVEGPTTEKARICSVEVRAKETRWRPCWGERSDRELIALTDFT